MILLEIMLELTVLLPEVIGMDGRIEERLEGRTMPRRDDL
jgi:hypothetical protein